MTSNIEWTEDTWNPIVGCSILSPGCTHCYAMRMANRIEGMNAEARAKCKSAPAPQYDGTIALAKGKPVWTGKVAMAPDTVLLRPLKRKIPTMYFVNSMGDLFHEDVPDKWIDRVFAVMALTPQHTYQVLTKRAARMRDYFEKQVEREGMINCSRSDRIGDVMLIHHRIDSGFKAVMWPLPNVWLGVSTERQQEYDARAPLLRTTPAAVRFFSMEPLLGPIVAPWLGDWVIAGGESGPGARPMHPDWARRLRDQCKAAGVPFFFKQWGEWWEVESDQRDDNGEHILIEDDSPLIDCFDPKTDCYVAPDGRAFRSHDTPLEVKCRWMTRLGKKAAGRVLDGELHDGMPLTEGAGAAQHGAAPLPQERGQLSTCQRPEGDQ